jgi:hypothetical protein
LFFNPYLRVLRVDEPSYDVGTGDVRTLVFGNLDWAWPEERVRIDKAYTDVQYIGPPDMFIFPDGWEDTFNTCVYGDGIVCPDPDPLSWLEGFEWKWTP